MDFISFKDAFHILESKEHLAEEGLNKLYALSKGMNTGRKFYIEDLYSPDHPKDNNIHYIPLDGHYINGFIAGDGCLFLHMGNIFGFMHLSISQHKNNILLMKSMGVKKKFFF